ncbi:MAG: dephospho-CoA kinase [Balneolaceae bacterium]|nr:dephospho-CoA kinase [Balneolaceae bacterium]MDR9446220.1 dephospho-CoA kinase [Balneolaceae bacterium]
MVIVGVTGGIGSGKSQLCEILETFGAHIYYADQAAITLMQSDIALKQQLVEAFGETLYDERGHLQRDVLAKIIFADPTARKKVESWVHPAVLKDTQQDVIRAKRQGKKMFVKEAALLLHHGRPEGFDHVVVIVADKESRIQRVVAHRGWSRQHVLDRMSAQMTQEEMVAYADTVIDNSGSLRQLHSEAEALIRTLIPS